MKDLNRIITTIKEAGFPFVKVELEAQFNREDIRFECCQQCQRCGGYGVVVDGGLQLCPDCMSTGKGECGNDHTQEKMLRSTEGTNAWLSTKLPPLVFSRFYVDGSCDSEITFTIETDRIDEIPGIIKSFYSISDVTKYCDIRGAGIHIALLQGSTYPSPHRLPQRQMNNFTSNMERLLPGLFFLGSGRNTRSLEMRLPRVRRGGDRHLDKYSAIYTRNDTVIEYRVFETCYRRPEMIFEYLAVVANSLRYYTTDEIAPVFNHTFEFLEGNSLQRFYQSKKSLKILDRQLNILKPWWKTKDQLKRERKFLIDPDRLEFRQKMKEALLRQEFEKTFSYEEIPKGGELVEKIRHLYNNHGEKLTTLQATKLALKPKEALFELFKRENQREVRYRLEV